MNFNEVIGQKSVVERLNQEIDAGKLPHALLLYGPEGNGGMALALAIADRLLSVDGNGRAMLAKLQHPDLHFSFPIYKKESTKPAPCDKYINQWRNLLLEDPYFDYAEWMSAIDADTHQLMIYADESDALSKKLSLKASQGGYRVSIIWLPEKMNQTCANKILKLLEEPPVGVVFVMVSEHPELLLETIRSRVQMINVPKLTTEDVKEALGRKYGIDENTAEQIARMSYGNMAAAQRRIADDSEQQLYFDCFVELMRLSYARKVREMMLWTEKIVALKRERQKAFLGYCQRMVRENFMCNFHRRELVYMDGREQDFAVRFAPFINESNVIGIMEELALCERDIAQNANAKIVFFDFALKMIVLIKAGKK